MAVDSARGMPRSLWRGGVILALLLLAALAAPLWPADPDRLDLDRVMRPPSGEHWLGTDAPNQMI